MKITIGHILILLGVGVFFALNGGTSSEWLETKADWVATEYRSLKKLFDSGEAISNSSSQPVEKPAEAKPTPQAPLNAAPAVSTAPAKAQKKIQKEKPKPDKTRVTKKKRSNKRLRKRVKRKPVRKKRTNPYAKLVNSYVEVELMSGRTVRGVLKSFSKTQYVIELPGLGPFTYEAKNVKSIKKA